MTGICCIWNTREDGRTLSLDGKIGGTRIEAMGAGSSGVRAAFGKGDRLTVLFPFTVLTSFFSTTGGFVTTRSFTRIGETGAKTMPLEGFTLVGELPIGSSVRRTVLSGCSEGFTCVLWPGRNLEMASDDAVLATDVEGLGRSITVLRAERNR